MPLYSSIKTFQEVFPQNGFFLPMGGVVPRPVPGIHGDIFILDPLNNPTEWSVTPSHDEESEAEHSKISSSWKMQN